MSSCLLFGGSDCCNKLSVSELKCLIIRVKNVLGSQNYAYISIFICIVTCYCRYLFIILQADAVLLLACRYYLEVFFCQNVSEAIRDDLLGRKIIFMIKCNLRINYFIFVHRVSLDYDLVSWDACGHVEGCQHFGGNFYIRLHCFPEDGGSRFFQYDGNHLAEHISSHPKRPQS
jgi:hypothetical protein